jgi:hypothetical protein
VLRGLGVVYVIAFASLRGQVRGLFGRRGIMPLAPELEDLARQERRRTRWRALPTLLWLGASDRRMLRLCTAGQLSGLALAAGLVPRLSAAAALALYLSFVSVGEPFLAYQWDGLLLEAGWLAVLSAPSGRRLRWSRHDVAPHLSLMLLRLLVFRLHFESGMAKLRSGDRSWRDGTACFLHYETQPLATPVAPLLHRLPRRFHAASTAAVLALETVVPFLAFGPRRARRLAFAALEGLQAVIAATGNFAFFNLLTGALTLSLLGGRGGARPRWGRPSRAAALQELGAELVGAFQLSDLLRHLSPGSRPPEALAGLERRTAPWHLTGSYGLFAVMTYQRLEIVIEGSADGRVFRPYELPHKPGEVRRAPRWIAPWQPRLDWQLWFAALAPVPPPWFPRLLQRLLEGAPEVVSLFAGNPFPEQPPRMVRALIYRYRLADAATRRATGAVWKRQLLGLYYPLVALAPAADGGHGRAAS